MSNLVVLFVHVMATVARLLGPGGVRSVVAESVLVKQQLLILNRSRQRPPNLCFSDRLVAGLCALFIRPARLIRSAIVLKPSTLLSIHQALRNRKYRLLFSCKRKGKPGPKGPSKELIDAVKFEEMIRSGVVGNYTVMAQLGQVSRSRVTQVTNLLNLAPDIP